MSNHIYKNQNSPPSKEESMVAMQCKSKMIKAIPKIKESKEVDITINLGDEHLTMKVPSFSILFLFKSIIETAKGNTSALIPISSSDLSTQEAADLLGVSRPYLIKLLEQKKIAYHKIGSHRRVHFMSLMEFKEEFEKKSEKAMDDLVQQAQELGLGY